MRLFARCATLRTEVLLFAGATLRTIVLLCAGATLRTMCYSALKLLCAMLHFADATLRPIGLLFVMNLQLFNLSTSQQRLRLSQPFNSSTLYLKLETKAPGSLKPETLRFAPETRALAP